MTYRLICPVKNNQVIITLPPDFVDMKQVTVVIDDFADTKAQKIEQLKSAMEDSLFLEDVNEISQDFDSIENETL